MFGVGTHEVEIITDRSGLPGDIVTVRASIGDFGQPIRVGMVQVPNV